MNCDEDEKLGCAIAENSGVEMDRSGVISSECQNLLLTNSRHGAEVGADLSIFTCTEEFNQNYTQEEGLN